MYCPRSVLEVVKRKMNILLPLSSTCTSLIFCQIWGRMVLMVLALKDFPAIDLPTSTNSWACETWMLSISRVRVGSLQWRFSVRANNSLISFSIKMEKGWRERWLVEVVESKGRGEVFGRKTVWMERREEGAELMSKRTRNRLRAKTKTDFKNQTEHQVFRERA